MCLSNMFWQALRGSVKYKGSFDMRMRYSPKCQCVEKVSENIDSVFPVQSVCFLGLFAADMLLWQMRNTVEF